MRRLLPALLLTCAHAGPSPNDFPIRLARFHVHYDSFVRKYLGCPTGAQQIADCDPKTGSMDYREFAQSCREAIRLFALPIEVSECQEIRQDRGAE